MHANSILQRAELQAEEVEEMSIYAWLGLPANEVGSSNDSHPAAAELNGLPITPPSGDLHLSIPAFCFELAGDCSRSPTPMTPATTAPPLPRKTLWSQPKDQDAIPSGYVATLRHRELLEFKGETVTPRRHFPQYPHPKEILLTTSGPSSVMLQESLAVDPALLTAPEKTHDVKGRRRQSLSNSVRALRLRGRRLREANVEPKDIGRRLSVLGQHEQQLLSSYNAVAWRPRERKG